MARFSCRRLRLGLSIEIRVEADEGLPLRRHFVVLKDGVRRAFRLAETTADARFGVDKELVVGLPILLCYARVDGVYWADGDARLVLAADTGFRDDRCHN